MSRYLNIASAAEKGAPRYSRGVRFLAFSAAVLPFLIYFNPGGNPVFIGYFPFILLLFAILEKPKHSIQLSFMAFPIYIFYIVFLLSLTKTEVLVPAIVRMTHITVGFFAYFIVINIVRSEQDIKCVLNTIHLTGFLVAGLGIILWIIINIFHDSTYLNLSRGGTLGPWLYGVNFSEEFVRSFDKGDYYALVKGGGKGLPIFLGYYASTGLFATPSANGIYTSILVMMDLVLFTRWDAKRCLLQIMLWVNLFLTQSRGSWISLCIALLFHWWWNFNSERTISRKTNIRYLFMKSLSAICIIAFIFTAIGFENVYFQVISPIIGVYDESADAGTTAGRLAEFEKFKDIVANNPFLGIGFDKSVGSKYVTAGWEFRTHNEYFNMAIFLGIFGLLAYLSFIAIPFYYSFKLARLSSHVILQSMGRLFKRLAVFWGVSAIGIGRLDNPKDYLPYWVLTGLLMAAAMIGNSLTDRLNRYSK